MTEVSTSSDIASRPVCAANVILNVILNVANHQPAFLWSRSARFISIGFNGSARCKTRLEIFLTNSLQNFLHFIQCTLFWQSVGFSSNIKIFFVFGWEQTKPSPLSNLYPHEINHIGCSIFKCVLPFMTPFCIILIALWTLNSFFPGSDGLNPIETNRKWVLVLLAHYPCFVTGAVPGVMTLRGVEATRDMHLMHGHAFEQEVEMRINIFDWNVCQCLCFCKIKVTRRLF